MSNNNCEHLRDWSNIKLKNVIPFELRYKDTTFFDICKFFAKKNANKVYFAK